MIDLLKGEQCSKRVPLRPPPTSARLRPSHGRQTERVREGDLHAMRMFENIALGWSSPLARLRRRANLTTQQAEQRIGIPQGLLRQVERGKAPLPAAAVGPLAQLYETTGDVIRRSLRLIDEPVSQRRPKPSAGHGDDGRAGDSERTPNAPAIPVDQSQSEKSRTGQRDLGGLRGRMGISHPAAAERVGVSAATMWLWEQRKAPVPQRFVAHLAELYNVSRAEIERAVLVEPAAANSGSASPTRRSHREPPSNSLSLAVADEPPAMSGEELRRIRQDAGLSQAGLGAYVGTSQAQLSRWERGKGKIPSEVVLKLREYVDHGWDLQGAGGKSEVSLEAADTEQQRSPERRRSLGDRAVEALRALGEPATVDQLMDELGGGVSRPALKSELSRQPSVKRTSKRRYGLRDWPHDEYTGVSDEIAQKIDEAGGMTTVDELLRVVPSLYEVSSASVRSNLSAPRFVVEGNFVRLRTPEDPTPTSVETLELTAGCYTGVDGAVVWRVTVDSDVLRGSGMRCPPALAEAVGVAAGGDRIVSGEAADIRITWPLSRPQPAVGSLREWVRVLDGEEGDLLFLRFSAADRVTVQLVRASEIEASTGLERVALLTGQGNGAAQLSLIAQALWLSPKATPAEVRARFRARGEDDLAESMPQSGSHEDQDQASAIARALAGLQEVL